MTMMYVVYWCQGGETMELVRAILRLLFSVGSVVSLISIAFSLSKISKK